MTMMSERPLRVGLCGIGLDAYWPQFAGQQQRLEGYVAEVGARFARPGVEVVNLGLVDTPMRSSEAGHQCRREDIDVLFLYVTTYASRTPCCRSFSAPACRSSCSTCSPKPPSITGPSTAWKIAPP